MLRAVGMGLALRSHHRIAGVAEEEQVERVAAELGIEVIDRPMASDHGLRGLLLGNRVYRRKGMTRPWRVAVLAHETGHYALGHATGLYERGTRGSQIRSREERQATAFAGALLLGAPYDDSMLATYVMAAMGDDLPAEFLLEYVDVLRASGIRRPP